MLPEAKKNEVCPTGPSSEPERDGNHAHKRHKPAEGAGLVFRGEKIRRFQPNRQMSWGRVDGAQDRNRFFKSSQGAKAANNTAEIT